MSTDEQVVAHAIKVSHMQRDESLEGSMSDEADMTRTWDLVYEHNQLQSEDMSVSDATADRSRCKRQARTFTIIPWHWVNSSLLADAAVLVRASRMFPETLKTTP